MDINDIYKTILYGNKWIELYKIDSILNLFYNKKILPKDIMYASNSPEGWSEVVDFLISEKLIESHADILEITEKGVLKYKSGGYMGEHKRKRLERIGIILGIIASICTVVGIFL